MSFANDKISLHARYIGANALTCARLRASGFQNMISVDALAFESGNRADPVVFVGEEEPSTNYDTYAVNGDEYIRLTFSSGTPLVAERFLRTNSAWARMQDLIIKDVTLTTAQLLAGHSTAVDIVAAPGAGKIAVIEGPIMAKHVPAGTPVAYDGITAGTDVLKFAYDGNIAIAATSGTSTIASLELTGLIDNTNSQSAIAMPAATYLPVANKAIKAKLGGAIATGTGGLKVRIAYRIYSATGW